MTNKSLIAVDMDDVLFDFLGAFFIWHNQQFGSAYQASDMVYDKLWKVWDGTKEEALERIQRFWQDIDQLSFKPIDGAAQVLRELSAKYRLKLVSARCASTAKETQAWIDNNFINIFEEVILGVSDPMAQKRPTRKADLCLEMAAIMLIDDQLVHALECNARGIECLLFGNLAHNQSETLPKGVRRVEDWKAIRKILLG